MSGLVAAGAGDGGLGGSRRSGTQAWKTNDFRANKTGPHHTVYWVRHNPAHAKSKKLGLATGDGKYLSGSRYQGDWVDNRKEGFGTLTKPNGERYEGDWVANKKHGKGTLLVKVGGKFRKKYTGDWHENKRHVSDYGGRSSTVPSCAAASARLSCTLHTSRCAVPWQHAAATRVTHVLTWNQCAAVAPTRVCLSTQGLGVYFYDNGSKYEGEWYMGKRTGRGKMMYADGDVYEGEWVDDKRAGLGVLTLSSGDHYEGHWHNDKKEGPGRFFYLATRKMYEGEWADDVAKCGVFSDIPFAIDDDAAGPGTAAREDAFVVPPCMLADADEVVVNAVDAVRAWRLDQLRAEGAVPGPATSSDDLTDEEFAQLQDAFAALDADGSGLIMGKDLGAVLGALGIEPAEEDIAALLEELGATADSPVAFQDFADVMARLRE